MHALRWLPAAALLLAAAPAPAQDFTFRGIGWDSDLATVTRRLSAQGYRFVAVDSELVTTPEYRFVHGQRDDSVYVRFSPLGLFDITWASPPLSPAEREVRYRERLEALQRTYGRGVACIIQFCWIFPSIREMRLVYSLDAYPWQARLHEAYMSPNFHAQSAAAGARRILPDPQRPTSGWYARRVDANRRRPIYVTDSLVVSWDSAGARTLGRLVTARVRWDWREVHVESANPPYDAEEREIRLDCRRRERQDLSIRYFNAGEMVHDVPIGLGSGVPRWYAGPAGPQWDRVVRALCRRAATGAG